MSSWASLCSLHLVGSVGFKERQLLPHLVPSPALAAVGVRGQGPSEAVLPCGGFGPGLTAAGRGAVTAHEQLGRKDFISPYLVFIAKKARGGGLGSGPQ